MVFMILKEILNMMLLLFVDQVNHEIGTYEGSFSLSDVQVLTSTAGS